MNPMALIYEGAVIGVPFAADVMLGAPHYWSCSRVTPINHAGVRQEDIYWKNIRWLPAIGDVGSFDRLAESHARNVVSDKLLVWVLVCQ